LQILDYSFEHLPFSTLYKSYVGDFQQLDDYYKTNPFDAEEIARKIEAFQFRGDRSEIVDILTPFNQQFGAHQIALDNIQRFKNKEALAVVTGQQLGIYGGSLYTIFKTISVIHLANKMEKQYDRPVIPVFWLADEDHDYDEVRDLNVFNSSDEVEHLELPPENGQLSPVAEMSVPQQIEQMRSNLRESLYNTDFSGELWELLDNSFEPGNTFLKSFGLFISNLFSKHGLVLAGSNNPRVKKMTGKYLKKSISSADQVRQALEDQTEQLNDEFHQQVKLYDSNLFYLDEKNGRAKISRNETGWEIDAGRGWKTEQLVEEIEAKPENFSPNVFLRPILQDALLPTIGYVAGPGETAYYGQMKKMYSCFDLEMHIIFPRLSATIVEPAIDRILNELPFEFHEYDKRIEDLESDYVDRTEQHDIEAIFKDWKEKIQQLAGPKKEEIADIDTTLEGAVEKSTSVYFGELDKLKGKVYRAVKKQDEIQLKRIRRIKTNLFPSDTLQERVIAAIFYMNKYGVDIWDRLLDSLDEDEEFDQHKLIYF
jgi:bacillithiol biosynthesis cysteine-adding enzyme BshC